MTLDQLLVQNPSQGLFDIVRTEEPNGGGSPAIRRHQADRITTLETAADARLRPCGGQHPIRQPEMLERASRLHAPGELGHASQCAAAILTVQAALRVSSWITHLSKQPSHGDEQALCPCLNGTRRVLSRTIHANRTSLRRNPMPRELVQTFPAPDVERLPQAIRRGLVRMTGPGKEPALVKCRSPQFQKCGRAPS